MNEESWYHKRHHHHKHYRHHPIEAVTVCIGYDDFLEEAIKNNQGLFDRWIVMTSPEDENTRELCRRYSVQNILSNDHLREGDFNKGRLIERGLQHLSSDGWRIHIDGDVLLPHNFRNIIKSSDLNPEYIYGADRVMVKSREKYNALVESGWLSNDFHCRVNPPYGYSIGSRWAHHSEGYVPIGFFQMWNSISDLYKGARIRPYPMNHNDACRTDVQFALQWDRSQRHLIPELLVVHLESEPAKLGANWNGRKTKRF